MNEDTLFMAFTEFPRSLMSSKICYNTSNSNKGLSYYFSKKRCLQAREKFKSQKDLFLNDEVIKNNDNVIILIMWLMLKSLIKSKGVLYHVYSDLGEVNSFYSSFSEVDQKAPCFWKVWKTLPGIVFIFKPELLFFCLNFLAVFMGKGLQIGQKWSHWHMKSHLLQIYFKHMFN